jgi:DNA-binding SARP family transcriptional activator
MGEFALWRGGELTPAGAWFRPIVRKLFQYFALHRGAPLARDRILEDLWPDVAPEQGWTAFRTAYSRLRQTLDPAMRAKGPARYFAVSGDTYRFDPQERVVVDVETFQEIVRRALRAAEEPETLAVSPELLDALAGWEALLPELPYEEWLLEARERLQTYYVDGCLAAANGLFGRGQPAEAARWARRALDAAPWLEQGYQLLMRAYARQGQRARALKTYQQAVSALARELEVEPSPLTQWLAARVQRGEDI